jgi:hypothetical protein
MHDITILEVDEIARLRLLKSKLEKAQHWISERVGRCLGGSSLCR